MKQFKKVYINGSSLSCGGSLNYKSKGWQYYVRECNINPWVDSKTISYGNVLANMLGAEAINEAKEGGGLDRVIRKTYDYISNSTLDELDETIFVFDIPLQPARFEVYSKEHNDWFVVAVAYNGMGGNSITPIEISRDDENWESNLSFSRSFLDSNLFLPLDELKKHDKLLNEYVNAYHDYEVQTNRLLRELTMFYCFLDKMGIHYFRDNNETIFAGSVNFQKREAVNDLIEKLKLFESSNPNIINSPTIWNLSEKKGWRLVDESPIDDAHLGYYGNIKYAEYLYKKIENS